MHNWLVSLTASCIFAALLVFAEPATAATPRQDVGFHYLHTRGDVHIYEGPSGTHYYYHEGAYYPVGKRDYKGSRKHRSVLLSFGLPGLVFHFGPRYRGHRHYSYYGGHKYKYYHKPKYHHRHKYHYKKPHFHRYHKHRHVWKHGERRHYRRPAGHKHKGRGYRSRH